MDIPLGPELEAALAAMAKLQGTTPEELVRKTLAAKFLPPPPLEPRDEWERRLLALGTDRGFSPPDSALTREELYD